MTHEALVKVSESDFNSYNSLPLAIYVTHADGKIVRANKSAIETLQLSDQQINDSNILDYYLFPDERQQFLKKLSALNNGDWLKGQEATFRINNVRTNLKFYSKVYKIDCDLLGLLCVVYEVKFFEILTSLNDSIPLGMFEVAGGLKNLITYRNKKFSEILGISDDTSVESILDFFYPKKNAKSHYKSILSDLRENGFIKDRIVDLIKKDGKSIAGKFNVYVHEKDENDKIIKARGILEDITYNDVFEALPIGVFNLKLIDGEYQVVHCNQYFADIFVDGGDLQKVIGKPFKSLIGYESEYKKLVSLIDSLPDSGVVTDKETLLKNHYLVVNNSKEEKEVIIHIRKLAIRNEIRRFNGVVYDVSYDIDKIILKWKQDIEAFLHTFSSMCVSINQTVYGIISAHGTDVVKEGKVNTDLAYKSLRIHCNSYLKAIDKLIEIAKSRFNFNLLEDFLEDMSYYNERLKIVNEEVDSKSKAANIRQLFINIRNAVADFPLMDSMPNELKKNISYEISEVLRFARLVSLHTVVNEVLDMATELEELKQFLLTDFKENTSKPINIIGPLQSSVDNLQELALIKNINIKMRLPYKPVTVNASFRDLYLAFYNIVNNSVKYSWVKPNEIISTVNIDVTTDDIFVYVSVENRGVGILKEEIDSGRLFEWAYRGHGSNDRRRKGTGIGLWHSNKIIKNYGGEIFISSKPIDIAAPNDFSKPFITKLTIKLPLHYAPSN